MSETILVDETSFYLCNSSKKDRVGLRCRVSLTKSHLTISELGSNINGTSIREQVFNTEDITGCLCMRGDLNIQNEESSSIYLTIYLYALSKTFSRNIYRKRETILLRCQKSNNFQENSNEITKWRNTIMSLIRPTHSDAASPKLLIFVNPNSGSGTAVETFKYRIRSFLGEADIFYDLVVTEYPGHCYKYIQSIPDLTVYIGIIAVSGDGLLYEIYNGLYGRDDWQLVAESLPVGIIPQGSGNGLARSLAHFNKEPYLYDPLVVSVLNVVKLRTAPMDLCLVNTKSQPEICSFLSIGWGLLADIDIESERLRLLGEARFTIWALARLMCLRTYKATISYLPADLNVNDDLPPLNEPIQGDKWITETGEFVCVYASVRPYIGTDLYVAPEAQLSDGVLWLIIIKGTVTRLQAAQFLIAINSGSHVKLPFLQYLAVKAFRLVPEVMTNKNNSYLTVDGERMESQPVQVRIMPHKGRIFMR